MELKEILAISGQPGLYKYVAQSSRGVIVESLSDGKRMNAASNSKVSALTEISIFTEGEDIPLAEVFTKIYEHTQGQPAISHKEAPEKLKAYFAEVLPEYDRDRVHVSDMKKVFSWFNTLVGAGVHRIQTARRAGSIKIRRCSLSTGMHRCQTFARIDNTAPIPHLTDGAFL